MKIRSAVAAELEALSQLCRRSKAIWGYDESFMNACRRELTLTVEDLSKTEVAVAETADRLVVGVAQVSVNGEQAWIEKLFVEPTTIGTGVGGQLYQWCLDAARARGATTLIIEADPDAEAFYRKQGAVRTGSVPSGSVPGRRLPKLIHTL